MDHPITVTRRILTAKPQVQSQGILRAICCGQSTTERGLPSPKTLLFLTFSIIPSTLHNRSSIILMDNGAITARISTQTASPTDKRLKEYGTQTSGWNLFTTPLIQTNGKRRYVQKHVNFYPGSWTCNVTTFSINEHRHLWCNFSNKEWYA